MSAPKLSHSVTQGQSRSGSANALVWTRSGSGANLVVMTDNEIAVGTLPKSELNSVEQRLEMGVSVLDAIGDKGKLIHFHSIESITADLTDTDLIVVFQMQGRTKTIELRFPDSIARHDALEEARSRMRGRTQLFETTRSRLSHFMKPLNFVVLFGILTTAAHFYFESDPFEAETNRQKFEQYRVQSEWHRTSRSGHAVEKPPAPLYEPSRRLSENPILDKILGFGFLVIGSLTMILNSLGYSVTMSILTIITVISLASLVYRLTHPPRVLVLVRL